MEQKWRQSGLPLAPPRPCPTPGSCSPHRPPQQPTQVSAIPHLRGLQRLGELAPGTGGRLIADLLSHQGAVFKAAEVHTMLREVLGAFGVDPQALGKSPR